MCWVTGNFYFIFSFIPYITSPPLFLSCSPHSHIRLCFWKFSHQSSSLVFSFMTFFFLTVCDLSNVKGMSPVLFVFFLKKRPPGNHVMQYTPTAKRTLVLSPDREEERETEARTSCDCHYRVFRDITGLVVVCLSLSVCVSVLCRYSFITGLCHHVVISSWFSSPHPVDFCLLRNGSRPLQADITSHVTAHFTHARLWSELHAPPFTATGRRSL